MSQYGQIIQYVNLACNYPEVFVENRPVMIVNSTKKFGLAERAALMLKRYGFNVPDKRSIFSTRDPYPRTTILYPTVTDSTGSGATSSGAGISLVTKLLTHTGVASVSGASSTEGTGTHIDPTLDALSLFFYGPEMPVEHPKYATDTNGPTIEIVLGDDAELFLH